MAFSLLVLAAAWLATAAVVLTLARLIAARPRGATAPGPARVAPGDDDGVVVALVPRGRNRLVPVHAPARAA